jgi:predicted adenine nucleotide alpha hydrolase (AANH) superfamily ATPase
LIDEGHEVTGFFYNPNIHPYTEYKARLHALQRYSALRPVEVIYNKEYDLEDFLRSQLKKMEDNKIRCEFCFEKRLDETATTAKEKKFDAFTTTLLESKYQPHEMIRTVAENCAEKHDIEFHYQDFREGWKESVKDSKELELYRQKYCGCIFSELERYKEKQK